MSLFIPQIPAPINVNSQSIVVAGKTNLAQKQIKEEAKDPTLKVYFKSNTDAKFIPNKKENKLTQFSKLGIETDYKTDSFRIDFAYGAEKNSNYPSPDKLRNAKLSISIQLNNDSDFYFNKDFQLDEQGQLKDDKTIHISSFDFNKQVKSSDLKSISFTFSVKADNYDAETSEYLFAIKEIENYKKEFIFEDYQKELKLDVESGFSYSSDNKVWRVFTPFIIKPVVLQQNQHNKVILEIKEEKTSSFYRSSFKPQSLTGLPFKKGDQGKEKIDLEYNDGNINFVHNSYYDLAAKETKLGAGTNSHEGYVIPYNYDQDFYPEFDFDINQFSDLKLVWTQKIDKPYFDGNQGQIKLKVDTDDNPFRPNNKKDWIKIPANFFENPENQNLTYDDLLEKLKNLESLI